MKNLTFLAIESFSDLKKTERDEFDNWIYETTISGQALLPVGNVIPIINIERRKCIGIGQVSFCGIGLYNTLVRISCYEVSDSAAEAYYSLYKNTLSSTDAADPSEAMDAVIPGSIGLSTRMNKPRPAKKQSSFSSMHNRRRSSGIDFSDYD